MVRLYGRDDNDSCSQASLSAQYVPITAVRTLRGWFYFKSFNMKFLHFTDAEVETESLSDLCKKWVWNSVSSLQTTCS